ncbi:TPA: hypothetical protein ACIR6N_002243 [Enterobacter hormaechei]
MSTITKEWLLTTIAQLEEERDATPGAVNEDAAMSLAAMRLALASLEAEPVAYMHRSGQVVTREECCDDKTFAICCKVETPLYTAPTAPVSVPDTLKRLRTLVDDPRALPRRKEWISGQQYSYVLLEDLEAMVDDACRAAMLQGAEPVTTAYKLPPHIYRELVNRLRDTAVKYQGCQQLREQLSRTLQEVIQPAAPQQEETAKPKK